MTQTIGSVLDMFFAWRSRHLNESNRVRTLAQVNRLPAHLVQDLDPQDRAGEERRALRRPFINSDDYHKIYSLD